MKTYYLHIFEYYVYKIKKMDSYFKYLLLLLLLDNNRLNRHLAVYYLYDERI